MTEQNARAALLEMGIKPTRQLIQNWLRAESAEEAAETEHVTIVRAKPGVSNGPENVYSIPRQTPNSESRLEPILREQGTLERPA